jgi:O-antigen/teichoic acid export membrane protein
MEIGKHLTKGMWGLADKALPVVYGVGYVLLVIRVLPEEEFGNFVLIQEIFLIISGLATAFALQPLLKFAAEKGSEHRDVVTSTLVLNAAFLLISAAVFLFGGGWLSAALKSPALATLMFYVPLMLAASFIRNFTLILLQSQFRIKEVFWTDAVHFLGAPFLTWIASRMHQFDSADDLLRINVYSLSASSLLGLFLSRRLIALTATPDRVVFRRVWDFGKFSLGGIVSFLVYSKSDTFVLSAVGGPVQVAVYNSAKVFVRVFEMVGQVLQMFLLPAASRLTSLGQSDSLKSLTDKAILFSTLGMIPVFLMLFFLPGVWVTILYEGRYPEAVVLLRIFAFLSFVIPVMSVESNILLGLGQARLSFMIGLQMLALSVAAYVLLIPFLGADGAALGYVLATAATAWILVRKTNQFVPITLAGILDRRRDIIPFVRSRLGRK